MSTALATQRRARRLFLEIHALDPGLDIEPDADGSGVHTVKPRGVESLSPRHAERLQREVAEAAPALIELLRRASDENAAVRTEGRV